MVRETHENDFLIEVRLAVIWQYQQHIKLCQRVIPFCINLDWLFSNWTLNPSHSTLPWRNYLELSNQFDSNSVIVFLVVSYLTFSIRIISLTLWLGWIFFYWTYKRTCILERHKSTCTWGLWFRYDGCSMSLHLCWDFLMYAWMQGKTVLASQILCVSHDIARSFQLMKTTVAFLRCGAFNIWQTSKTVYMQICRINRPESQINGAGKPYNYHHRILQSNWDQVSRQSVVYC